MKYFHPASLLLFFASFGLSAQDISPSKQEIYEPGIILFKISETNSHLVNPEAGTSGALKQLLIKSGGGLLRKNFPAAKAPSKKSIQNGKRTVDLSRVYSLTLDNTHCNIDSLCAVFKRSGLFDWVQPRYVLLPMFTPNDPQIGQQYHHQLIKSFEAWDISTGDTNVVIGITDGGIQFDHNDLKNIRYNYADPINGLDDDHDGYIDNFRGWNAVNQSNDPTATLSPHGIFTTGLSSATVNNNIGVAGVAYKCKYIPIRIDNSSGFNYGFEGIVYAADMGCDIINASWGNTQYSPLGEEVIRYAQERNCLIVAAAGNSGKNEKYYPASFPGVVSVGATGPTDLKWSGSTFGSRVDLVAPGENVRSTWPYNGYDNSSGTSFSAPLVSGAAALVKSKFPSYNALQIAERLRVTTDTGIYELSEDSAWHHLMGSGRLNVYRALHDPEGPSIHFYQRGFTDNDGDQFAEAGDEISISGVFKNFLAPTKNLVAVMSCASPFVQILDEEFSAGVIAGRDSLANASSPFRFLIQADAPYNLDLLFKITYKDTGYSAFEYIEMRVNKDYMDMDVNNILTTITSRGNIGYAADYGADGSGFQYQGKQLMSYSGLMLGTSAEMTANNAYASTLPGFDNKFERMNGVRSNYKPGDSYKEIKSSFYTDSAATQRIEIKQRAEASSGNETNNFAILHFTLINRGNQAVTGLHAGIFTDWDIRNAEQNQSGFDAAQKLSYAFDTASGGIYAGIRQLSNQQSHGYAFNSDGAGSSLNLYDGFSDTEKFQALSGSSTRDLSMIGDIASLIGTGMMNLEPGDSLSVSYALLAATSFNELVEKSKVALGMYHYSEMDIYESNLPLTCKHPSGSIQLNFITNQGLTLSLLNSDKVSIRRDSGDLASFAYEGLPAGIYYLLYEFADQTSWETSFTLAELQAVSAQAEANPAETTLSNPEVQFNALAGNATSFTWDFGDLSNSNDQNPVHTYSDTGTYQVRLIASNAWCADTAHIQVTIGSTVGIEQISNNISLFPVPAADVLHIRLLQNSAVVSYRIFTASGHLVSSGFFSTLQHDIGLTGISEGLYFVELQMPTGKSIRPFSIMRP